VSEKCRPIVPRLGGEDANLWSSRTADGVEAVIKSLLMPGTIVGLLKTVAVPTVIARGLRGSGPEAAPPRPTLLPPLHRREPRPNEAFPVRGTELPVLEDMRLVMLRITRWVRWCMSEARARGKQTWSVWHGQQPAGPLSATNAGHSLRSQIESLYLTVMSTPLTTEYGLHHDYQIISTPPLVSDYLNIRLLSGLSPKSSTQASFALAGSFFVCHAIHTSTSTPVAMGRVIGDGGWYFIIADMAVLPDHQRKGLGGAVLRRLLDEIKQRVVEVAKRDKDLGNEILQAYISLGAKEPGRKLFTSYGFVETAPKTLGMYLKIDGTGSGNGAPETH